MITVRTGEISYRLLLLLSVVGEYPVRSLHLLGNQRSVRDKVRELSKLQQVRAAKGARVHNIRVLRVSGKAAHKTVRLTTEALGLLEDVLPGSTKPYLANFYGGKFPGDATHIWRNHRVAEAVALLMAAGVETRPQCLAPLQRSELRMQVPTDCAAFYSSRALKNLDEYERNKTMFTRTVGALFYPGGVYCVYNTRDALMKWSGQGEFKAYHNLVELARMNAGLETFDTALLIGQDEGTALATLLDSEKRRRGELRFDRIYPHIHFIPMTTDGIRLLRVFTQRDWKHRLLLELFDDSIRLDGYSSMELDAKDNDLHIFSHLDSDLARLIRFKEAAAAMPGTRFAVMCYQWQAPFLRDYLPRGVELRTVDMEGVDAVFDL